MATLEEILQSVKILQRRIEELPYRIEISPNQVKIINGLSDIDNRLGLMQAGEFRSGNGVTPGDGFSGVRIAYPGLTYDSKVYNIVGVDNDTLMVGIGATDGIFYGGGGLVQIDKDGLFIANSYQQGIRFPNDAGLATTEDGGNIYMSSNDVFYFIHRDATGQVQLQVGPDTSTSEGAVLNLKMYQDVFSGDTGTPLPGLDLSPGFGGGARISMGSEVQLHAQGTTRGYTGIRLKGSSDPAPEEADTGHISMYLRNGNLVVQWYDGGAAQFRYKYLALDSSGSAWSESTDAL